MSEIVLAKYGEIALKGLNKNTFEDVLVRNIRRRISKYGKFEYKRAQSTLYISPKNDDCDMDAVMEALQKVFGIAKLCRAKGFEKNFEVICTEGIDYVAEALENANTFKVASKRADKKFPMKSPEICRELGGVILDRFPHLEVDVNNPDVIVTVEIREEQAFVHATNIDGAGGIPVGSSGRAMLLLSGGIDSPVAGYMMAKRGVAISAIHFESPPYTSERARMKVEKLASIMANYCGRINFYCVPFTEIQEQIKNNCDEEYFTIIMRRLMMEIAQRICEKQDIPSLVTGESIGQVASQTMYAMVCTDNACRMPVFRPVIGMDKKEIIEISRKIDTFETSIEPYEDCCTVFTPKHPRTKPVLEEVIKAQNKFDFEELIAKAVEETTAHFIDANK
ncbi:MAG: tRNA 4-thiouridine(8) synthase ThiI [Oscillospiraceae bacterium]|nr:tRNA 4-thiouridine(8) synthase ThiI [Oscillospiraceae bacterium]